MWLQTVCVWKHRWPLSLSAALAGQAGVMLSSCFSSSTWFWHMSPCLSFSSYFALSLARFLSFLSHRHGHCSLLWPSGPLLREKVSVLLLFIVHKPTGSYEVEFERCFLLKRAYMSMSLLVCLRYVCVCVNCLRVCVSRRFFLRQVDSCYLVAL